MSFERVLLTWVFTCKSVQILRDFRCRPTGLQRELWTHPGPTLRVPWNGSGRIDPRRCTLVLSRLTTVFSFCPVATWSSSPRWCCVVVTAGCSWRRDVLWESRTRPPARTGGRGVTGCITVVVSAGVTVGMPAAEMTAAWCVVTVVSVLWENDHTSTYWPTYIFIWRACCVVTVMCSSEIWHPFVSVGTLSELQSST